ncbi:endonuclease domain-containing protein [Hymenobacter edaphi]|uniref:Cytosine methyltransferase n=1 Tax=Hymenobacter edaphi TaxID=2211146 RepID=A0A328BF49_9BACT|nr:endonuclease domain-containing protein [Hymenobacter edaphi]RAK66060.1 cytosine methyltransferase [Hymenobacter edaphi]
MIMVDETNLPDTDPTARAASADAKALAYAWSTADRVQYDLSKASAQRMRQAPTLAEDVLWQHVRGGQLGARFRRQHVIDRYIADFICLNKKLIIGVDGDYHHDPEQQAADAQRTADLATLGFVVIRFSNEAVIYDTKQVLTVISQYLTQAS